MRIIKFHVSDGLWEAFYRLFPGHGERSGILRKVIREIVLEMAESKPLEKLVAERICEDWKEKEDG